jgi:hypothetical protein
MIQRLGQTEGISIVEHFVFQTNTPFVVALSLPLLVVADSINKRDMENPFDMVKRDRLRWPLYLYMMFMIICFSGNSGEDFFYFQF